MVLAEVFVPVPQRQLFRAWGTLLYALREASCELSDHALRVAKSHWWAQELLAVENRRPAHPIGMALLPAVAAPWQALASALVQWATTQRDAPVDADHALAQMRPIATAIAATESALFGSHVVAPAGHAVAVHWLTQRLLVGRAAEDAGSIPLHVLARHQVSRSAIREGGAEQALRDWAHQLHTLSGPVEEGAVVFRRMQCVQDRVVLECLAAGSAQPTRPGPRTLWRMWRAARAE